MDYLTSLNIFRKSKKLRHLEKWCYRRKLRFAYVTTVRIKSCNYFVRWSKIKDNLFISLPDRRSQMRYILCEQNFFQPPQSAQLIFAYFLDWFPSFQNWTLENQSRRPRKSTFPSDVCVGWKKNAHTIYSASDWAPQALSDRHIKGTFIWGFLKI